MFNNIVFMRVFQKFSSTVSLLWASSLTFFYYLYPQLYNKNKKGAGKMTQWLRALALLPENPCSIPRTNTTAHSHLYNSSPRRSDTPLLVSMGTGHSCSAHAGKNIYTYKIK